MCLCTPAVSALFVKKNSPPGTILSFVLSAGPLIIGNVTGSWATAATKNSIRRAAPGSRTAALLEPRKRAIHIIRFAAPAAGRKIPRIQHGKRIGSIFAHDDRLENKN